MTWDADVSIREHSKEKEIFQLLDLSEEDMNKMIKTYEYISLSGKTILNLMKLNATVRIFERVGTTPRRLKLRRKNTHKPDLFNDWGWPSPIPKDIYKPTFGGSTFQWVIMSQATTGTHIHFDPEITDAWNALLYGHKVWRIFALK